MTVLQMALFASDLKTEWVPPAELPDIFDAKTIAIDVETRDPNLMTRGPGWSRKDGEIVGYAVAVDGWAGYPSVNHFLSLIHHRHLRPTTHRRNGGTDGA